MIYQYKCDCGEIFTVDKGITEGIDREPCPVCGAMAVKDYATVNIDYSTIRRGSNKL